MEQINFEDKSLKPSQNLQIVIENLWTAIRGFVEKYQKQVEINEALKQENQSLRLKVQDFETKVEQLEEKLKTIEENYSPDIIQKYESVISELREENNFLQMYYEEYKKQKEFLEGSLFGYSESDEKLKELEEQLKHAQEDIVQKNLRINQLNDEIMSYKEKIAELENVIIQLEEKEKKLPILEAKIIELQKVNSEQNEQLKQYKTEIETFRVKSIDYDNLKAQYEQLLSESSELEKNLERTAVQKIEKEREIEHLSSQIQMLNEQIETFRKKEQELIDSFGKIFSTPILSNLGFEINGKNLSDYLNYLKQIVTKIEDLTFEVSSLQEENLRLKSRIDDVLVQNAKKIEELEQEIVFHKNRIAGLETELTNKEKERFKLDNQIKEFQADEEEKNIKMRNLEEENRNLKNELEKIYAELKSRQSKQGELIEQLEIYRTTIDDLNTQVESLNSELIELREKAKLAEEELQKTKSELLRKDENLRELMQYKNEFYKLQGEVNSMRQINKELKELNKQMSEEKIDLQRKIFALNKEKNDVQDNYLKALRDKEKIEILYNEKILEYRNLNEELTKLKMVLQEKEKNKGLLIEKISELISQIDNFIGVKN
ncbi:MAG: hypothetical protein CH6_3997 [Candidatus Kapaibacterium sp.]|nr:MAG: hypothetical protein CH6_3997 [Candidatus Kapabacteria bacterium]